MNYEIELVNRAKQGDANALNLLLDTNKSYIYAIAFALLKNHEDAEDAVQKTMITVWQSIGTLENPEAFKSWLYRIAHTRSLNVLQSKKNDRLILDDDINDMPQLENMESELLLPQAYAERGDLRERLYRIIDGLSAVQRETVVLYYFNDRSVEEITGIMDCSENTVKSRLYLARKAIKTEIEEQERKSGEKFYGIAVGILPFGYFVTENVKHSLPSSELLGRLVASAQRVAQSAVPQAANAAPISSQVGAAAAKAAAKGLPTALKAVLAIAGVAMIASAGIFTAKLIADAQYGDGAAPGDAQAIVETTAAPTEAATQAPTEPDYTDAYRAYLKELQNNKDVILDYDWQLGDDESRPVVFADIAGDDTPEMIIVCCDPSLSTKVATYLNIFQYEDGTVKPVYSTDDCKTDGFTQIDYNGPGGQSMFVLYQMKNKKGLCLHKVQIDGGISENIYSFIESDGKLSAQRTASYSKSFDAEMKPKAEIDSIAVEEDTFFSKLDEIKENTSTVLMHSNVDAPSERTKHIEDLMDSHENQAMTYDEAIAFLKGKLGIVDPTEAESTADFSALAGDYETTIEKKYSAKLNIDNNGKVRIHLQHIFTASQADYVGYLSEPAEIKNNAYSFKLKNMELTGGARIESGIDDAFHDGCTMSFYPKGFMPSDMTEGQFRTFLQALPDHTNESLRTDFIFFADNIMFSPPTDPQNSAY